jgi:2-polyprenyl-6-methoxyphenol hydroxylase-like FAD-dependent oxidoreductase
VRTAVVVGAGVGGLAAAGSLARSGWHVTLLERGDRLRGSGAAQLIWPNGLAALEALGLSLRDVTFPMPVAGIRRPDGHWLVPPAPDAAHRAVVVHADDLHDCLMAGLGERLEIRTGVEILSIRAGSTQRGSTQSGSTLRGSDERPAVTSAKHTFEADLIVAADGARSVIRRRLAPQSTLTSAGYSAWRAVIPWYRAPALPETAPSAGELLGAGHRFLYAALGDRGNAGSSTRGGIYWVATAPGALRPEPPATQLALLRRWFDGWQEPVRELLAATEPGDVVQQAGEDVRPLPARFGYPIGGGGIVLLGDAAHVSSPTLAQGACLAFEDAATLGAAMRTAQPGPGFARALDDYTELRRARVAKIARTSRRLGRVMQAQGRFSVRARDAALGRLAERLLDRPAAAAHDWSPDFFSPL